MRKINKETNKKFDIQEEQEAKECSLYSRAVQDMVNSDEPNY